MKPATIFIDSIKNKLFYKIFTWFTRILLSIAFIPSGLKKLLGERFTNIGVDDPVGFFFEALYQSGFYWNYLGFMQLLCSLLILIPRTTYLAAVLYLPIIININFIVISMSFKGTPIITSLMLLANIYLLVWDYKKTNAILSVLLKK
ncbi:hypothetical protein GCM10011416_21670 [Polaribacter pacificus]|uniref:DoxX protein n=1 Tax=Polaribacter pacificus TaxID=1775173 RepID=A0A917MFF0_9FLAO|nr:DoxX family membrane protein [Polaribacter pacificus]GGH02551.1 hypothetical protein GCM10011416_21670 [Polaribacter pacificus]